MQMGIKKQVKKSIRGNSVKNRKNAAGRAALFKHKVERAAKLQGQGVPEELTEQPCVGKRASKAGRQNDDAKHHEKRKVGKSVLFYEIP